MSAIRSLKKEEGMDLRDEVLQKICETLDVDEKELTVDKKLYDSIGVDSTEMVELTVALSKHFGVQIAAHEMTKFSTPLDIIALIGKKRA